MKAGFPPLLQTLWITQKPQVKQIKGLNCLKRKRKYESRNLCTASGSEMV